MIISMTGFGRGQVSKNGVTVTAEIRSVNSRFLEISTGGLPRRFAAYENEVRDMIKGKLSRGKLNLSVTVDNTSDAAAEGLVNIAAAKSYMNALQAIRKELKIKETVKLEHVLLHQDIFRPVEGDNDVVEAEFEQVAEAIEAALDELNIMRSKEGRELRDDMIKRIKDIEKNVDSIEKMTVDRIPAERQRLRERIGKLFESDEIDEQRLEMEIVILADKLDISEECVRMRSHIKFFNEALNAKDKPGRKINFLLQEMNREVNTMGSKSNDAKIAHTVVAVKEDLEKIREQVQNVE